MPEVQIDRVRKPDRYSQHDRITDVGGPANPNGSGRWQNSTENIIQFIEQGTFTFFTFEGGKKIGVHVNVSARGNKYLQTYADNTWKDNLLSLPEL